MSSVLVGSERRREISRWCWVRDTVCRRLLQSAATRFGTRRMVSLSNQCSVNLTIFFFPFLLLNRIASNRRTRHQVAAHQSCIIFATHSGIRSLLLPRVQKRTIHGCRSKLCARLPCTTNRSLASTPVLGFPKQQTLCAPNDIHENCYQAIVTRVGIVSWKIHGRTSSRRSLLGWKGGIRTNLAARGRCGFCCGNFAAEYTFEIHHIT